MDHMEFIEYIMNKDLIKATLQAHDHFMSTNTDIIKGRIMTKDFKLFSYNLSIPNDCNVIFFDICDKTAVDDKHIDNFIDKAKKQGISIRYKDDDDGIKYSGLININDKLDFDNSFFPLINSLMETGLD